MASTPTSVASPQSVSQSTAILSDSEGEVKCGSVDSKLYFNLLRDCTGNIGSVKCILHKNGRCTPNEFEQKGAWKS